MFFRQTKAHGATIETTASTTNQYYFYSHCKCEQCKCHINTFQNQHLSMRLYIPWGQKQPNKGSVLIVEVAINTQLHDYHMTIKWLYITCLSHDSLWATLSSIFIYIKFGCGIWDWHPGYRWSARWWSLVRFWMWTPPPYITLLPSDIDDVYFMLLITGKQQLLHHACKKNITSAS